MVSATTAQKMYICRLHSDLRSLATILLLLTFVSAGPYPKDNLANIGFSYLLSRDCASYCGAQSQFCCATGEACFTNQANIAFCSAPAPDAWGGYAVYTTTYTETNLVLHTSTYTSSWGPATPTWKPDPIVTPLPTCTSSLGESSCGSICCANDQRCAFSNSCTAHNPETTECTTSSSFAAPFRPTGEDPTIPVTTTVPFQPPATATGSAFPVAPLYDEHSLSGGAIAGIVIGSLVGIALLLLFCFSCAMIIRKKKKPDSETSSYTQSSESPREEKTSMKRKLTTIFFGKGSRNTRSQGNGSRIRQRSMYEETIHEPSTLGSSRSGSSHNTHRLADQTDHEAAVQGSEHFSRAVQSSRKSSKKGFRSIN